MGGCVGARVGWATQTSDCILTFVRCGEVICVTGQVLQAPLMSREEICLREPCFQRAAELVDQRAA